MAVALGAYWRASRRPISSAFLRAVGFSTVPPDVDLVRHIEPRYELFAPPIPTDALSIPAGFPFHVDNNGPKPEDIYLKRLYRGESIYMEVDKFNYSGILFLRMNGLIRSRDQYMTFRMKAKPDDLRFYSINIWDVCSRHVKGSEKYLEAKCIKPSTINILFKYLRNRVIPSWDEFPFEIKDGSEKGTLTLRKKCEGEIIMVDVKAVNEAKVLDKLAEYEKAESIKGLKQSLDNSCQYDFEDTMDVFEDAQGGNFEQVGDIGCLFMTVRVYYGHGRRIKMDVFAFPDLVAVPGISFTDYSRKGFKTLEMYFKKREIHAGTMNFLINYARGILQDIQLEPVTKVFGRFEDSQVEAAVHEAQRKVHEEFIKMAEGVPLKLKKT